MNSQWPSLRGRIPMRLRLSLPAKEEHNRTRFEEKNHFFGEVPTFSIAYGRKQGVDIFSTKTKRTLRDISTTTTTLLTMSDFKMSRYNWVGTIWIEFPPLKDLSRVGLADSPANYPGAVGNYDRGSGACEAPSGGGGGGPPMTSSAYYRRMRLHTASTLDLPVRVWFLIKIDLFQQYVCSKDLRTSTLAWSHPLPTHILPWERFLLLWSQPFNIEFLWPWQGLDLDQTPSPKSATSPNLLSPVSPAHQSLAMQTMLSNLATPNPTNPIRSQGWLAKKVTHIYQPRSFPDKNLSMLTAPQNGIWHCLSHRYALNHPYHLIINLILILRWLATAACHFISADRSLGFG